MKINIIVPTYNDKEIYNFIDCFILAYESCRKKSISMQLVIANDHQRPVLKFNNNKNDNIIEVKTCINKWWTESILVGLECSNKIESDLTIIATSDVTFDGKAIKSLSEFMYANKDISICHPKVNCIETNNEVISAKKLFFSKYLYLPQSIVANSDAKEVDMLSGRFAVIRSKLFREITFDKSLIHYAADYDFFLNASRKGHKLIITDKALVTVDATRTGQGKSNITSYQEYIDSFNNIKSRNYFRSLKYFYLKNFGLIYGCIILCAKITFDFTYLTLKKISLIK